MSSHLSAPYPAWEKNSRRITILGESQNWRCAYCGKRCMARSQSSFFLPTIDHVEPIKVGGLRVWENEVMACRYCNHSRGSIRADHYFRKVQQKGRIKAAWWAKQYRERKRQAFLSVD